MKGLIIPYRTAIAVILSSSGVESFAPISRSAAIKVETKTPPSGCYLPNRFPQNCWILNGHDGSIDEDITDGHCGHRLGSSRLLGVASKLKQSSKPISFALATAASFASCLPGQSLFRPQAVHASAPIVLREKLAKNDPPMVQAMTKAMELKKKLSIEEFDRFMQKCDEIEDAEGVKARTAYEKQYKLDQEAGESQKRIDIENLKRDLLDEGKDPNIDIDAENEVWKLEYGIDLEKVPGTPQNEQMIKNFQSKGKKAPTYESQRYIIKCQVADLKARGIDPLTHFSEQEVIDKTRAIYKMDTKVAAKVAKQYETLMEKFGGRLTPAKAGESPFVRPSRDQQSAATSSASNKKQRSIAKAAAKAERTAKKAEKKTANAEAKAARKNSKSSKGATAVATTASQESVNNVVTAKADEEAVAQPSSRGKDASKTVSKQKKKPKGNDLIGKIKGKVTVAQASTVLVGGIGAAVYGFNMYAANSDEDRDKQLKAIMGDDDDDDDEYDDDDDDDDDDDEEDDRLAFR